MSATNVPLLHIHCPLYSVNFSPRSLQCEHSASILSNLPVVFNPQYTLQKAQLYGVGNGRIVHTSDSITEPFPSPGLSQSMYRCQLKRGCIDFATLFDFIIVKWKQTNKLDVQAFHHFFSNGSSQHLQTGSQSCSGERHGKLCLGSNVELAPAQLC